MHQLDLLFLFMAVRMRYLSKHHVGFMATLHNRNFVIQLQTADGQHVRYFSIRNRHIYSRARPHAKPDFCLTFKDANYAMRLLAKATPMAFMKGMQAGDVKMDGDFSLLMWFNNAAKFLQPKLPKPVRQAYRWVRKQQRALTEKKAA